MRRWTDTRREIRSISEAEKREHDVIAFIVERLIQRREALGLTQQEVADRAGIKQSAVARLENGGAVPGLGTLVKVANALGLDLTFTPRDDEQAAAIAL